MRKPALQLSVPTPKRAYISNVLLPRMDKLIPKTCLIWWFRVASSPDPLTMHNNSVTFDPPSYNLTVQRSMLKKHSWGEPGDKAWFRWNVSLNDVEPSNCVAYCISRWCRLAGPISCVCVVSNWGCVSCLRVKSNALYGKKDPQQYVYVTWWFSGKFF